MRPRSNKWVGILLLIFCSLSSFAQYQTSSCTVDTPTYNKFKRYAAEFLPIHLKNSSSPYKDSIEFPQFLIDKAIECQAVVYNQDSLPGHDTLYGAAGWQFYLNPNISDTLEQNFTVLYPDIDTIIMSLILYDTSGIPALDSLVSQYKIDFKDFRRVDETIADKRYYGTILYYGMININVLNDSIKNLTNMTSWARYNTTLGDDPTNIKFRFDGDTSYIQYTYGWGDCQSGCIHERQYNYKIIPGCDVSFEGYSAYMSYDPTPPILTLVSPDTVCLKLGETYYERGATATDARDGDITNRIQVHSDLNTNKAGIYTLKYVVRDLDYNLSDTLTRTVYVIPAPKIVLSGSDTFYIDVNTTYNEPGYTAYDIDSSDITDSVKVSGTVNNYKLGSYELSYQLTSSLTPCNDQYTDLVKRVIVVEDRQAPKITIKDKDQLSFTTKEDPNVDSAGLYAPYLSFSDNYYSPSELKDSLYIDSHTVTRTDSIGVFQVFLRTKDGSGNISDSIELKISFSGTGSIDIYEKRFSIYPDPASEIVYINIENSKYADIELYTLDGKLIRSEHAAHTNDYPFALPNQFGSFVLRVKTDNGHVYSRTLRICGY